MLTGPDYTPDGEVKQIVVLLHGLGADGNDLIELAAHMADQLPHTYFTAPDAPFPCDMAPMGRQWFSLQDRSTERILEGVQIAVPLLNEYIDHLLEKYSLEASQLCLLGFSQGTMLSLHAALRRKDTLGGVLGYSGALVSPATLKDDISSMPPVCLVHGEDDQVVPFEAFDEAKSVLQALQVPVQAYSRAGLGHGIDPAGLAIGIEFLKACQ